MDLAASHRQEPNRMKMVAIAEYLTDEQIKLAAQLRVTSDRSSFMSALIDQVIQPNLSEINRKLGQENNARFLAYAVDFALSRVSHAAQQC